MNYQIDVKINKRLHFGELLFYFTVESHNGNGFVFTNERKCSFYLCNDMLNRWVIFHVKLYLFQNIHKEHWTLSKILKKLLTKLKLSILASNVQIKSDTLFSISVRHISHDFSTLHFIIFDKHTTIKNYVFYIKYFFVKKKVHR